MRYTNKTQTIRIPALLAIVVTLGAGSVCAPLSFAQVAASKSIRFDIAAQDLGSALRALGQASRQQIVFDEKAVRGMRSAELAGLLSVEDALQKLLAGTGLRADRSSLGVIVIEKAPGAESSGLEPADQMRVAALEDESSSSARSESSAQDSEKDQKNQLIVRDSRDRPKPFSDANVDLPRTISDEQPYYIFDQRTLERSGAANIEDFLKNRLTMNTVAMTSAQDPTSLYGNSSSINLRGLGTDHTLILVNGRRVAGMVYQNEMRQADLNGIPLSAIDRIEVLPSSASGIYGGSAIGGVVNVILKSEYSGGEARISYEKPHDSDAQTRTISGTFGQGLEGGKTQVLLTGQWSDSRPLLFGDRRQLVDRGVRTIQRTDPGLFFFPTGTTPNIMDAAQGTLVLRDGRSLGASTTFVPAGTAPGITMSELSDELLANAGVWNMEFPRSTQGFTGLLRPLGSVADTRSGMLTLRRRMSSRVEAFLELSHQQNESSSLNNTNGFAFVPAGAPTNPFVGNVYVNFPSAYSAAIEVESTTRSFTGGVLARLPRGWTAQLDYSWSQNRSDLNFNDTDNTGQDFTAGILNPFVDTSLYPLDFAPYDVPRTYDGSSVLRDFALRGAGQLMRLPWGVPSLAFGLERRMARNPANTREVLFPINTANNFIETMYAREQTTDSVYAELHVPLVPANAWRLARSLELQLSVRNERYKVDSGTAGFVVYPNDPGRNFYSGRTVDNLPFEGTDTYGSVNTTVGVKYQPVPDVTLRGSLATAFLPPAPSQLVRAAQQFDGQVSDPTGDPAVWLPIKFVGGGNPDLKPQNSRSLNIGLIWEPSWNALRGMRLNTEYYRISQFDQIISLDAQTIVDREAFYPGRVVRDGTGRITFVDASDLNLFKLRTEGWDLSLGYRFETGAGAFDLQATQTRILHEQRQLWFTLPMLDYAGYVNEGGPAKLKTNVSLNWENDGWTAGWTAYGVGSYRQYGASGGPNSISNAGGGIYGSTVAAQGGQTIGSQAYHDLFVGYSFGRAGSRLLDGVVVQGGLKNVFNTAPPFDAYYSPFFISPYGDKRMRTLWLNAGKQF